jgi:hypothetical protein
MPNLTSDVLVRNLRFSQQQNALQSFHCPSRNSRGELPPRHAQPNFDCRAGLDLPKPGIMVDKGPRIDVRISISFVSDHIKT